MDIGLLILRCFIGGMILAHGTQKVFGAFGGLGPDGTTPLFEAWGLRPGRPFVLLAGVTEIIGGTLLVAGLLTPLGAAMGFGALTVASSVIAENGLWAVRGGFELPLTYALVAGCLAFIGPGAISLDAALGLVRHWGVSSGVLAIGTSGAAAAGFIIWARRQLRPAA